MKFLILIFLLACSVKNQNDFKIKAVEFKPEKPTTYEISDLNVGYAYDPELPFVNISLIIRSGSFYYPPEENITLTTAGALMRSAGTISYSPEELDLLLEKYSANLNSSTGNEFTTISLSCLKSDLENLLPVFKEVILNPRYDLKRINLFKGQAIEGIIRRKDNPDTIAAIAFNSILFGNNQIGRVETVADVKKIKRLDLVRKHREIINSKDKTILFSGDISKDEVINIINSNFSDLKSTNKRLFPKVDLSYTPKKGIYFIEGNFQQSSIFIGQKGIKRLSPDDFKISAFNSIFGSDGFSSRLTKEIRTNKGLAYGIFGGSIQGTVTGKNIIAVQTKTDSTAESIISSVEELEKIQKTKISDEELNDFKISEKNSFVFNFIDKPSILQRAVTQKLLGYPNDYDENYMKNIESVTIDDVQTVANKYWDINNLIIIIVGNSETKKQLEILKNNAYFKDYQIKELFFDQKIVE